ncbi:MAG: hypothetical protein RLY93_00030 [Sumerlaeia bacterium]
MISSMNRRMEWLRVQARTNPIYRRQRKPVFWASLLGSLILIGYGVLYGLGYWGIWTMATTAYPGLSTSTTASLSLTFFHVFVGNAVVFFMLAAFPRWIWRRVFEKESNLAMLPLPPAERFWGLALLFLQATSTYIILTLLISLAHLCYFILQNGYSFLFENLGSYFVSLFLHSLPYWLLLTFIGLTILQRWIISALGNRQLNRLWFLAPLGVHIVFLFIESLSNNFLIRILVGTLPPQWLNTAHTWVLRLLSITLFAGQPMILYKFFWLKDKAACYEAISSTEIMSPPRP